MDLDCIELFNVAEAVTVPGSPGAVHLSRFPLHLETKYLIPRGKIAARMSNGCEVRLSTDADPILFRISSPDGAQVETYQGDFWLQSTTLEPGRHYELKLFRAEMLKDFPRNVQAQCTYGLDVIRLVVDNGVLYLHDIDTYGQPYRKPSPESLPRTRWLAYGSSITEASSHGYIHEAARLLKIDVLNKGMSGSCGLEESTARYLVDDCDWDFTTLEWGVNLRGRIEPDEFERRVNTALDLFVNTGRPVFVITVLPNHAHLRLGDPAVIARQNRFDEVLRDACTSRAQAHPNLSLIEGPDVLHEYSWLTADLIHPTRDGHARMGRCLADLLCKRLD